MPFWARVGSGAGVVVRAVGPDDGQGGSGVLEQALSNTAASTAETFQGVCGNSAEKGWGSEPRDVRRKKVCMVMVFSASEGPQGGFVTAMLPARLREPVSAYIPLQTCR